MAKKGSGFTKGFSGRIANQIEGAESFDVSLLYDTSALSEIPSKAWILTLKDKSGYTLLHHAADVGCSDALELLLAKKGKHYKYSSLTTYINSNALQSIPQEKGGLGSTP